MRENETIAAAVEAGQWDRVIDYVNREVFDKPEEYYTLDKLRKAAAVDRRLTLREILEKIFGLIPRFKSKDELLEEEFAKFVADRKPEEADGHPGHQELLQGLCHERPDAPHHREPRQFTDLATNPVFSTRDFRAVPAKYRALIPEYVKDYVSLNQFARIRGDSMLDTDTKRRIDTARDILVGKVPDPKSQVEQITIALIYKFMDDMDAESEELGGKRKFFAGEFARYGWAKLMRSGLGGHEMLNLYAEGIGEDAGESRHPAPFPRHFQERLSALSRPGDAEGLSQDHRRIHL